VGTNRIRRVVAVVATAVVVGSLGLVATPSAHAAKLDKITIGYSARQSL